MPSPPKMEVRRALCILNNFFITNPMSAKKIKNTKLSAKTICKTTAKLPHANPARRISLYVVRIAKIAAIAVMTYTVCRVVPSDEEIKSNTSATTSNKTPDQILN